jgi:von Willebrand factor type A domain
MRKRQIGLAFIAITLGAAQLPVQTDSCLRRTVPVSLMTGKGSIVTELTEINFKGSVHHHPVKILSVTPNVSPARVMIVLDASGSMTAKKYGWDVFLSAAKRLVEAMPANTLVGLTVFSSKIEKTIPLMNDGKSLQEELAVLASGSKTSKGPHQTALWDALSATIDGFGPPHEADSIYAITDGEDNASKTDLKELKKALLARRIRLFFFSVAMHDSPVLHEQNGPAYLQDLTESSGGYGINLSPIALVTSPEFVDHSGKLTASGQWLLMQFRQIFTFQRVELELPEVFQKTEDLDLKTTGLNAKDLILTYPHKLPPCTQLAGANPP